TNRDLGGRGESPPRDDEGIGAGLGAHRRQVAKQSSTTTRSWASNNCTTKSDCSAGANNKPNAKSSAINSRSITMDNRPWATGCVASTIQHFWLSSKLPPVCSTPRIQRGSPL